MGNSNKTEGTKGKIKRTLEFLTAIARPTREWVLVIVSCLGIITFILGTGKYYSERQKEAAARYMNIMRDFGDQSDTVRAGAAITMNAHLEENYDKYGEASIIVLVNQLAKENSAIVRMIIQDVLFNIGEKDKDDIVIQEFVSSNRELWEQSDLTPDSLIRGDPVSDNLQSITDALIKIFKRKKIILSDLDMSKIYLTSDDYSLKEVKFMNVQLGGACLVRMNLEKVTMKGCKLNGAFLDETSFKSACLAGAELKKAYLVDADLEGANLEGANLEGANLKGANLKGANLGPALLLSIDSKYQSGLDRGTIPEDLQHELENNGIQLTNNATLLIQEKGTKYLILSNGKKYRICKEQENLNIYSDTILDFANLQEVDLTGALLTNASLQGATLTDANMVNATLQGVDLVDADLTNANLAGADLFEANLTKAILEGADLEAADLAGADLEGADLKAAVLFRIDSEKFQSDLDERTISKDLQQEFENNRISLSQSIAISMEEKDRRWLINDKDNEQIYTVRKEERLNICTEPKIVETELFVIGSKKFQSDLDKGIISEDLRQELKNNRIDLSQDTSISIEKKDHTWLINEKDYEQTFTVRKEDGQLKIYERTKLDPTELFSIDSKKFQKDFDDVTILEDLRQEFKNNWLDLSDNTAISVKEKGRIWRINDKDNKQIYIVRKEEWLNICEEIKFKFEYIKKARNWQKAFFDDDVRQKLLSQQN